MQNNKITHEEFKEWLQLSVCDELNDEEMLLLKSHLASCESCRTELEELRSLSSIMKKMKPSEPDEETLLEARRELRAAIRIENSKRNLFERMTDSLRNFFTFNYKIALGGAATLIVGFFLGYLAHRPASQIQEIQPSVKAAASGKDILSQNNIKIDNLRFQDSDAADGEVSFTFDAVKPVQMKGNINDEMIQKVLAHALVNESNDGVRLRTIGAIAEQTENEKSPDPKIKAALITTIKHDQNPGVRREALLLLQKFTPDKEITDALLYVLSNDTNSGLRIAAINSLTPERLGKKNVDQELINVLKQKSQTDNNEYIRIRAKSVLQEVASNETL